MLWSGRAEDKSRAAAVAGNLSRTGAVNGFVALPAAWRLPRGPVKGSSGPSDAFSLRPAGAGRTRPIGSCPRGLNRRRCCGKRNKALHCGHDARPFTYYSRDGLI